MTVGLQIFDASGNIILDATYRVLRFVGSVYINGDSGSRTDSRLGQGAFASFQPAQCIGEGYLSGGVIVPQFSFSGNTISWTYAAKNNASYDIVQPGFLFYGAS